jgi:hypothetical protein
MARRTASTVTLYRSGVRFVTYLSKFCKPLDLKQSDYIGNIEVFMALRVPISATLFMRAVLTLWRAFLFLGLRLFPLFA